MALADPLGLGAFADLVRVSDIRFTPQWQQQRSIAGGGETLYADRAPMLWTAEITTPSMLHAEAEGLMALINSRGGGLKAFLLYNSRSRYPSSDPDGSVFGAATPLIGTITDRLNVAFTGFPANYPIPLGAYFQVIFSSTRYYLGQFAEAATASGAGAVATVAIAPALPASVVTGNPVTVIRPAGKFRVVPNSAHLSTIDATLSRLTLSAEQTYAA